MNTLFSSFVVSVVALTSSLIAGTASAQGLNMQFKAGGQCLEFHGGEDLTVRLIKFTDVQDKWTGHPITIGVIWFEDMKLGEPIKQLGAPEPKELPALIPVPNWQGGGHAFEFNQSQSRILCGYGVGIRLSSIPDSGGQMLVEPLPINSPALVWYKNRQAAEVGCKIKGGKLATNGQALTKWLKAINLGGLCTWTASGKGRVNCGDYEVLDGHADPSQYFAAVCEVDGELKPVVKEWDIPPSP